MLTTAATWFYFVLTAIIACLLINDEQLLKKEAEYEHRKSEKGVKKNESLSQNRQKTDA